MGNITELKQGNLDGLKKQVCECIDHAHEQGYKEGKNEPREVKAVNVEDTNEYQIGYKVGREDGYNKGIADSKDALFTEKEVNDIANKERQYGYNQGLEDASNLLAYADKRFIRECFPFPSENNWDLFDLNAMYGLEVVIKEFKEWQEQKKQAEEEIKVGDEVCHKDRNDCKVVITSFIKEDMADAINFQGSSYIVKLTEYERTGRHFDEVEQLLDKLKGDKE